MRIGFIGTGLIAAPMIRGLEAGAHQISISPRTKSIAEEVARDTGAVIRDNQAVLDNSDIVFICLLANVARDELPKLTFRQDHRVISVMAELDLVELSGLIAPATGPAVTLPLPFIATGGCPLPCYPESLEMQALYGDTNTVFTVTSESAMPAHFAGTALLSTIMKAIETTSAWLGDKTGDEKAAEIYMTSLVGGYLSVMPKDGSNRLCEALKDLSTEGGLNTQLLHHMTENLAFDALHKGMDDLGKRLKVQ